MWLIGNSKIKSIKNNNDPFLIDMKHAMCVSSQNCHAVDRLCYILHIIMGRMGICFTWVATS